MLTGHVRGRYLRRRHSLVSGTKEQRSGKQKATAQPVSFLFLLAITGHEAQVPHAFYGLDSVIEKDVRELVRLITSHAPLAVQRIEYDDSSSSGSLKRCRREGVGLQSSEFFEPSPINELIGRNNLNTH